MTDIETTQRPLILHHADCMDGLAAAWVCWRKYGENADYVPVCYGEPAPDCKDRSVYILDFCYSPEETTRIADEGEKVVVLDHHKTAIERFEASWVERSDVKVVFDLARSGAQLTAHHFNVQGKLWIVDYAEDRDLWRWKLPSSREINALLAASTMGRPPLEAFGILDELRGYSMKKAAAEGAGAQAQIECYARQIAKDARSVTFAGHADIPVVNIPKPMASDALHALTKTALFAVGWRQVGNKAEFSLRSEAVNGGKGFDCAALAERFGGGGHHNAAGFTLGFEAVEHFILGKIE